jgi:hypothetical protein
VAGALFLSAWKMPSVVLLIDRFFSPILILDSPDISSGRNTILQAAALCLSGVAALELFDSSTNTFSLDLLSRLGTGDALSLVQAVGFGTGVVSLPYKHYRKVTHATSIMLELISFIYLLSTRSSCRRK